MMKTLLVAGAPFALLAAASLLSLGIVEIVETGSGPEAEQIAQRSLGRVAAVSPSRSAERPELSLLPPPRNADDAATAPASLPATYVDTLADQLEVPAESGD